MFDLTTTRAGATPGGAARPTRRGGPTLAAGLFIVLGALASADSRAQIHGGGSPMPGGGTPMHGGSAPMHGAGTPTASAKPLARSAHPADPGADVPALVYRSSLSQYRRHADPSPKAWRDANDEVLRIGGWRAYLREAASAAPDSAPSGAPASSAATGAPR